MQVPLFHKADHSAQGNHVLGKPTLQVGYQRLNPNEPLFSRPNS